MVFAMPELTLPAGESILRSGRGNHLRGREHVGGALFLTQQRLVFVPHGLNLSTGHAELHLPWVRDVTPGWTKVFGLIPLVPNTITVQFAGGWEPQSFVVSNRAEWIRAILEAVAAWEPLEGQAPPDIPRD